MSLVGTSGWEPWDTSAARTPLQLGGTQSPWVLQDAGDTGALQEVKQRPRPGQARTADRLHPGWARGTRRWRKDVQNLRGNLPSSFTAGTGSWLVEASGWMVTLLLALFLGNGLINK